MHPSQLALLTAWILAAAASTSAQDLGVQTIAGARPESLHSRASMARFTFATGIHTDRKGNIYVADSTTVKKISPSGTVTILAGKAGVLGSEDGPAADATFRQPRAIAFDSLGNLFVADDYNHLIRKISPDGMVSTYAGIKGMAGRNDGPREAATFNFPRGLLIDASDNIYIADQHPYSSGAIRKIDKDGHVTTLQVKDQVPSLRMTAPEGLALDSLGNLYVADYEGQKIYRITPDGTGNEIARSNYGNPTGVAVDGEGNVYFSETWNYSLKKRSPDGQITLIAGSLTQGVIDGVRGDSRFYAPRGVAFLPDGNLVVADSVAIRKVTPAGEVSTIAGAAGHLDGLASDAHFLFPQHIDFDGADNLYIADTLNHVIRRMSAAGEVTTLAGKPGFTGAQGGIADEARFNKPSGLAVQSADSILVADTKNSAIRRINSEGLVTDIANGLEEPVSVTAGPDGIIYAGGSAKLYVIRPGEAPQVLAGSIKGFADGIGINAKFSTLRGIAIDKDNNLIVADSGNNLIRKVSPLGEVTTFTGKQGSSTSKDGPLDEATFTTPVDVQMDKDENIYVTENTAVRKISPEGMVSTVLGTPGRNGLTDGLGSEARLGWTLFLAMQPDGTLYISDSANSSIRKASSYSHGPSLRAEMVVGKLQVKWNAEFAGYVLETSDAIHEGWSSVESTPILVDNSLELNLEPLGAGRFYRLKKR